MKSLIILFVLFSFQSVAQDLTQNIRGVVTDKESQYPIPGALVKVLESNPIIQVKTDIDGNYTLMNVPIGRVNVEISYPSYEPALLRNLELTSGKELIVNVSLEEMVSEILPWHSISGHNMDPVYVG